MKAQVKPDLGKVKRVADILSIKNFFTKDWLPGLDQCWNASEYIC